MSFHRKTAEAARGKWRGILVELGIPSDVLKNRHGPCPICGGKDRFRWDNREGSGSYICGQCGAGSGMQLAQNFLGEEFPQVAGRIDKIVGNIKTDSPKDVTTTIGDDERRAMLSRLYRGSRPIQAGDVADRYLRSRGIHNASYPKSLRFIPRENDGQGGSHPCMIAMVGVYGEPKYCSIHKTFLKLDGSGKAEIAKPRLLTRGEIADGACIALSDYEGGPLGIAEGIETALSASAMFDLPVWAALNSNILKKWRPPEGCSEIVIFGDNDPTFGGQAAAFDLAHKLAVKGIRVEVQMPETPGQDWNDIWISSVSKSAIEIPRRKGIAA